MRNSMAGPDGQRQSAGARLGKVGLAGFTASMALTSTALPAHEEIVRSTQHHAMGVLAGDLRLADRREAACHSLQARLLLHPETSRSHILRFGDFCVCLS